MEGAEIKKYYDSYVDILKSYPEYEGAKLEEALFNKLFDEVMEEYEFYPSSDYSRQMFKDMCWTMWKYGARFNNTVD